MAGGAGAAVSRHPVPARRAGGAQADEASRQRRQGARAHPAAGGSVCPDIAIRSTFVVGFPGETEADFQYLLDWLDEAQLDRVGAFRFEPVARAPAPTCCPIPVPEEVKEERYARIMEKTAAISAAKLADQGRPDPVGHRRRGRRRGRDRPIHGRCARHRRRGVPARCGAPGRRRHRTGQHRGRRRTRSVRGATGAGVTIAATPVMLARCSFVFLPLPRCSPLPTP